VRVQLELGSEQVVRIANDGNIASAERDRIFEPFVRGAYATVEGRPGVGLGLAIARQLAVKLQGTLELAPHDPAAARVEFVLRLPQAKEEARAGASGGGALREIGA
jgi:signal transduction histidine kinase